jgi:hypothetical protein
MAMIAMIKIIFVLSEFCQKFFLAQGEMREKSVLIELSGPAGT